MFRNELIARYCQRDAFSALTDAPCQVGPADFARVAQRILQRVPRLDFYPRAGVSFFERVAPTRKTQGMRVLGERKCSHTS